MAFISAGINAVHGVIRTRKLPILIEKLISENNTPILESIQNKSQRFSSAFTLYDGFLITNISQEEKNNYLKNLKEEYYMASNDLSKISASKAETAALAIAIKELALNMDSHIVSFQNKSTTLINEKKHTFLELEKNLGNELNIKLTNAKYEIDANLKKIECIQEKNFLNLKQHITEESNNHFMIIQKNINITLEEIKKNQDEITKINELFTKRKKRQRLITFILFFLVIICLLR